MVEPHQMTHNQLLRQLVPNLDDFIKNNPNLIKEFRKRTESSKFKPFEYLGGCM